MFHQPISPARSIDDPVVRALDRLTHASQQMQIAWLAYTKARGVARRAEAAVNKLQPDGRRARMRKRSA